MKIITLAVLILLTAIPITTTAQEIPEAAEQPASRWSASPAASTHSWFPSNQKYRS